MKKLVFILMWMGLMNNFTAQTAEASAIDLKLRSHKEYNGINGAKAWGLIGAGSIVLGTAAYFAPEVDNKYYRPFTLKHHNQIWRHDIYKGVVIGSAITTGLSIVFATNDLIYYFSNKKSQSVTLNLSASPTSAALCLNFK